MIKGGAGGARKGCGGAQPGAGRPKHTDNPIVLGTIKRSTLRAQELTIKILDELEAVFFNPETSSRDKISIAQIILERGLPKAICEDLLRVELATEGNKGKDLVRIGFDGDGAPNI